MTDKAQSSGCDALGVLLIVFLVLKIAGLVQWSWWFVLAPLWGALAVGLAVGLIIRLTNTMFK